MTDRPQASASRAAELRFAFDRSFAETPAVDTASKDDLLAVRLGAARYALRLAEIRGIFAEKKITRVPARHPTLLGIASFRGAILPVYSLHRLLGHGDAEAMKWLAVAREADIALAFETVEGHLRMNSSELARREADGAAHAHVHGFVRTDAFVRGVIDLPSVVVEIRRQISRSGR